MNTIESARINERDFEDARDVFETLHRVLGFGGFWPLDPTTFLHLLFLLPYILNGFFGILDLLDVFGDLELTVINLGELLLLILISVRMIFTRYSRSVPKLIVTVLGRIRADFFGCDEERRRYLEYNVKTKVIIKVALMLVGCTAIMYHCKPLVLRIEAVIMGETDIPYMLPYRVRLFFSYNNPKIYCLVYFLQTSNVFMNVFVVASSCLIYAFCFHCCGELSALQYRIKNINKGTEGTCGRVNVFRALVDRHFAMIKLMKNINETFQVTLLEELVMMTAMLGLSSYCATLNVTNPPVCMQFVLYASTVLTMLFAYCYVGQALITESLKVQEAFYESLWYDLPKNHRKSVLICLAGTSNYLKLTGGSYYVFSSPSFTAVVKTAGAYLSMLRTVGET